MEIKKTAGMKLLRLPTILDKFGLGRSTHYKRVKAGLFTSPVKQGERVAAWPESEVEKILHARVAGKSEQEIKEIVAQLETDRMALA